MGPKDAAAYAKRYVAELFGDETIGELGLEEIDFDYEVNEWKITVGFSRPWPTPRDPKGIGFQLPANRSYKMVRISEDGERIISVKDRALLWAEYAE